MYNFTIDSLVTEQDLPRLREKWFKKAPEWDEFGTRLRQAVEKICRQPKAGESLRGRLREYYKFEFCSSSVQGNWPHWPDMRILYEVNEEQQSIHIWLVGRRLKGDPDDVYRSAIPRRGAIQAERAKKLLAQLAKKT